MSDDDAPSDGVLDAYVEDLLAVERDQRDSLERRAGTVLSSSGIIVTVLLALTALATRNPPMRLDGLSNALLFGGAGLFAVAAVSAIVTATPQLMGVVRAVSLGRSVRMNWDDRDRAAKKVVATRLVQFADMQRVNHRKAIALTVATIAEAAAVVCLSGAVVTILAGV